jgi:hypothetical protein
MEEEKNILEHSGFKTIIVKKSRFKNVFSLKDKLNTFNEKLKTDRQKFIKLCVQTAVCALILLMVISLKAIDKPFAVKTLNGLNQVISNDVDIDEDLGKLKFVSDDLVSVFNEDLSLPVEALSYEISDDGKNMMILGKKDEPVFATFSGNIVKTENSNNENLVIIMHESGIKSIYTGVMPTVFEDDSVLSGQAVGYLLDDYLQVNILYDGEYLDPEDFIKDPILR